MRHPVEIHTQSEVEMVATLIFVVLVLGITGKVKPFGPKAGPYDIDIEKLESCEKQGSGKVVFGTRITKAEKGKYIYKENFTFEVPFDGSMKSHLEVQKWGNGGWRPKSIEHKFKNCETLWNMIGDFFKSLMKSAGVSLDKCPIPAGKYKADNWLIELNLEKGVPVLEYSKYRMILHFYYKDEFVGCIMVYAEAKPKAFGSLSGNQKAYRVWMMYE